MQIPKKILRIKSQVKRRLKVKRNQRKLYYVVSGLAIFLLFSGLINSQVQSHQDRHNAKLNIDAKNRALRTTQSALKAVQQQKATTEQQVKEKAQNEAKLKAQVDDLNKQLQSKRERQQSIASRAVNAVTFTATASAAPSGDIQGIITAAANRYGVSPQYLLSVASCESGFNLYAHNPSGATGLFQFMPSTFYGYGGHDLYSAYDQSDIAAKMFSMGQAHQWSCA